MMKNAYSVQFCSYTIGVDAYQAIPEVCRPFGTRILLIAGEKALEAAGKTLEEALEGTGLELAATTLFGEDCTCAEVSRCGRLAEMTGVDMIFGLGGGKALDTAKGAADLAGLPVFTLPTIAATCAATTALSVTYHEDGSFDKFLFFPRPARHCFIHTGIIAAAPAQYLRAGMGDTIGKHFECHFAARGDALSHSSLLGREISNLCYAPLLEHGVEALRDCEANNPSHALEQAVLANVVSTGMVSLLVLDQYNGALAHSVCYGLSVLSGFEQNNLHGDVVAYGVLVQLAVDGNLTEAARLKSFLTQLGIPTTLSQMGVTLEHEGLAQVLYEIVREPDMSHIPYPITEEMVFSAMQTVEAMRIIECIMHNA